MRRIIYHKTSAGSVPVQEWLEALDLISKAKVKAYIERVAMGGSKNNLKPVGDDKSTQSQDIREAISLWRYYA